MMEKLEGMSLFIDAEHVQQGVSAIARCINEDFPNSENEWPPPVVVVVLKGGFIFGADLLKALNRPWPVVFATPRGQGQTMMTIEDQALLRGRNLIVVDVLMDSGGSQNRLLEWLRSCEPASIRLAVLLHKTVADPAPVPVDYLGFEVPNVRLVGYGLDEEQQFRGLDAVFAWWK